MTRGTRLLSNIAIGVVGLVLVLGTAVIITVRTNWFLEYVREKIISATEEGTGGKTEIGAFSFDVSHLRAVVNDFVIHGREPASEPPFLHVARVELDFRLLTSIRRLLDITYLGAEKPEVNVIVFPDGSTNIPSPKEKKRQSDTTALETLINLAVDHFNLSNGLIVANARKQEFNLRGNNLHAELWFNPVKQAYAGRLDMEPLYAMAGKNTPVTFRVHVPFSLEKNSVDLRDASITTPVSSLAVNGSLEDPRKPKISARLNGQISLADLKNLADLPIVLNAPGASTTIQPTTIQPTAIQIDANATASGDAIQVTGLRVALGRSTMEASGTLKDQQGHGALQFRSELALGELGRLVRLDARPEGTVELNGLAKLDSGNNYEVGGNIQAKNLSFAQGRQRISGVSLQSAIHLTPQRLDLQALRLNALGAEFLGNVSLEEFRRYRVDGKLRSLDIETAAHALGMKKLPYSGVASGPLYAAGDTQAGGVKGLEARAQFAVTPGTHGIPVSGALNAHYSGASDNILLESSYIALPHTRISLNGSLNNQLNVALNSRDLNDLLAAGSFAGPPPVQLNGGSASFNGTVTGGLTNPRIAGRVEMKQFEVEGRAFQMLSADLNAARSAVAVRNGSLTRGQMVTQFSAQAGLRDWAATQRESLTVDASVRGGDLADVMALTGQSPAGYSGALTANAHIEGTIANPCGTADIEASDGTLYGESFNRASVHVNLADRLVTVPAAWITSGSQRVDLSAEFRHPADSFTTGQLHAHLRANQMELAGVRYLQKLRPNTAGMVQVEADIAGDLRAAEGSTEFLLAHVTANGTAQRLMADGQNYGDVTLSAQTAGQTVSYNVASDFAGSNLRISGKTQLVKDYPTEADAEIGHLPIERVLVLAKQTNIPARGSLSGTAHFSGTAQNPQGNVDLDLANANIYDEPLDRVRARVTYLPDSIEVSQLVVTQGAAHVDLSGRFDHPVDDLSTGKVQFKVDSTRIDLARIRNVQKLRPGLGGALRIAANGGGAVQAAEPRIQLTSLGADLEATALRVQGNSFGNLTLKADTRAGNEVGFRFDSDLAASAIHGEGNVRLTADYPVDARLTFNNIDYNRLRGLIGPPNGEAPSFDLATDGSVTVTGPVMKTDRLNGSLQLTRLSFDTLPRPGMSNTMSFRNQGPVRISMENGAVRIDSAHVTGPQTDLQATGTASIPQQTVDMMLNATANLALLQSVSRDILASGGIAANVTVRGTFTRPQVYGQLDLKNASLNHTAVPNGISNANGSIVFNGSNATIRSLTGESGGGKLTASGFLGYTDQVRVGLRAQASGVRYRVQQGVSAVANADVRLSGTTTSSVLSGTVTVDQLTYAPQSDIGAILSRSAPPVQSAAAPTPLLENMKLDIRVQTSPALGVQASLAQNLQASADLRVRGTAAQPGILGRVVITEGKLVFFGSTYTVNSGTIAFYNPLRIEPVLNVSLETQAKGVDVVLTVTGPVDNMKLSYTSDPPLQFQEIIGLLASGKSPTSDPTLLANEPSQSSQSFEQMGESAIVSKALADPVANRLQRVFGVTQLKIDPAFTSGSQLPTARLTFQQQITSKITFTYTSALDDPNSTIVRAEWALNPQYSAIATRDQNGLVSVLVFYKKQFR